MCNKYMEYLNNYFGGKEIKPICREERQYALFLYNKLLNMVGKDYNSIEDNDKDIYLKIFDLDEKHLPKHTPKLLKVYYEVTFMRDFLEQEKQIYENDNDLLEKVKKSKSSFNHKLFDFVKENSNDLLKHIDKKSENNKIISDEIEKSNCYINKNLYSICPNINYCSKASDDDYQNFKNEFPFISSYMSAMMNSKADLGIRYIVLKDNKEIEHLKLIECKYLSEVDKPNLLEKIGGKFYISQCAIQYYITKFICEKLFPKSAIVADYTLLVNFRETHPRLCKINCNRCDNSFESNNIDCLSNYIKKNAKFIPLDSLIPDELKNSNYL